jgi:hypothetical protein
MSVQMIELEEVTMVDVSDEAIEATGASLALSYISGCYDYTCNGNSDGQAGGYCSG